MKAKLFSLFVLLIGLAISNPVLAQSSSEDTNPDAWTVAVCNGEAAIVFQSRAETGDGVTVAPYDEMECENDSNLGWFVVEPWSSEQMNPDSGCLATSWSAVGIMARETTWENGSGWRVYNSRFAEHPMVVSCSEVTSPDTLGLNPNELQVQLDRQHWVIDRALELLSEADMSPAQYCNEFEENLATYLCALPAFTNASAPADTNTDEGVAEPTPTADPDLAVEDCPTTLEGETLDEATSREAGRCVYTPVPSSPASGLTNSFDWGNLNPLRWFQNIFNFVLGSWVIVFILAGLSLVWWFAVIVRAWRRSWIVGGLLLIAGFIITPLAAAIIGEMMLRWGRPVIWTWRPTRGTATGTP